MDFKLEPIKEPENEIVVQPVVQPVTSEQPKENVEVTEKPQQNVEVPVGSFNMTSFIVVKDKNYITRSVDADIKFWAQIDKETGLPLKPIALLGESGSGKNHAIAHYAASMNLPLLVIPCDDSQVLKELLGYWKATAGTTVWCEGLLCQFLRFPCVIQFDECNCLPAGRLFMLHELLQNRRLFVKDAPSDQSIINLHPEVRLFLSMNPPEAKYSGTNRLNTALANRTIFIHVPPFKDEEILNVSTGNAEVDAKIIHFYKEVSALIKEQKLRISISKRNIDAMVVGFRNGMGLKNVVMQSFINSCLATASETEQKALINTAVLVFGASNFKAEEPKQE